MNIKKKKKKLRESTMLIVDTPFAPNMDDYDSMNGRKMLVDPWYLSHTFHQILQNLVF